MAYPFTSETVRMKRPEIRRVEFEGAVADGTTDFVLDLPPGGYGVAVAITSDTVDSNLTYNYYMYANDAQSSTGAAGDWLQLGASTGTANVETNGTWTGFWCNDDRYGASNPLISINGFLLRVTVGEATTGTYKIQLTIVEY